ncbi:unnamed protein product, partial [Prorocentrum cordatum]
DGRRRPAQGRRRPRPRAQARETDGARLRQMQRHHGVLGAVEAQIGEERAAAERELQALEAETQEIYSAGEAEILRLGAERDATARRARERCEAIRDEAERRCRELGALEREALARLRQAQAREEARRASRVAEAEERLEEARGLLAAAVETAQVSVAERVKALAGECSAARANLLDTRERLDGHVRAEIDRRRGDTDLVDIRLDSILRGQQAEAGYVRELEELAQKLRHAGPFAETRQQEVELEPS